MNPHETETTVQAMMISFFFVLGGLIGMVSLWDQYKVDAYECTVKCPSMAHSIRYRNSCYCEAK